MDGRRSDRLTEGRSGNDRGRDTRSAQQPPPAARPRDYCTLFDRNYAGRAVALHASLMRHAMPFTLWMCCMDDDALRLMERLALPNVRLMSFRDLEAWDPRLATARGNRSTLEYFFTCAPALPLYVLDVGHASFVAYLDADLFVYSSLEPLFDEMGKDSVLIVPHRFAPRLRSLEKYGRFNVGLVAFRGSDDGLACLRWWHERCLEWCHDRLEGDRYGDQKYLDRFVDKFRGVHVLRHMGGGVGPWNLTTHDVRADDDGALIGGDPIVFAHLHGVRRVGPGTYRLGASSYKMRVDAVVREHVYRPYIEALEEAEVNVAAAAAHLPAPKALPRSWSASHGTGRPVRWLKQALLPRIDRARARLYGDYMRLGRA